MIHLYYAGHMDNKAYLAAIGLGNMIQNCFVLSVFLSMNASLETLVS